MCNYVIAYTDALDPLRQEDFHPGVHVSLELIPTFDESKLICSGSKDYYAISNPERFVCACVRKVTVDEDFLRFFSNLKMIQIISAGYEGVNLDLLRRRDIQMANARGLYSGHMAEDIIMRMIYLTRKMHLASVQQRKREWITICPVGALENSIAVFIGAGSIACETAKRLVPFGMRVFGIARSERSQEYFERVYTIEKVAEILCHADFVVACLPEDKSTEQIIDARVFGAMKPGAIFINVGRGSAVDEDALYQSLITGHIASASSDVFAQEPLSSESPFWNMPNFLVTPHYSGGYYEGAGIQRRAFAARNISKFLLKQPIECRIT